MATLRTANNVAPGALPDMTLIRREDLLSAAQSGLIYPLEGLVPSAILGDLYDVALELGQVDGQIYGLPFMLEGYHLAYHGIIDTLDVSASFDDFLLKETEWVFSGGRADNVTTDILFAQYLDAGGTPSQSNGKISIDSEALSTVLTFYEQALTPEYYP